MPVPVPAQPAPPLRLPLAGGGEFDLAAERPRHFTMVVFYHGWHCPVCRGYLAQLDRRIQELDGLGVSVVAVSGDSEDHAKRSTGEWGLNRLRAAYGQALSSMRAWGLFVSKGIKDPEPELLGEPGVFLIRPDATIHMVALNSMPAARPRIEDLVQAIQFFIERVYPPRGEA
jgi:peroxiredoxin